ncbi:hypothetical protein, partial [Anabaena azotica]
QAELYNHLEAQAQAVAPESLTIQEIHSHHFEIFAGNQLIAYITYDNSEFITQRWVVMVRGEEQFRHSTIARCLRYVEWHHKDGSLPTPLPAPIEYPEVPTVTEISFHDQELIVDGELVASIEYDHDNYQDLYWRVIINKEEIYRDTTPARCHSYVKQAYQQGMLPVQKPFEEPSATGNEIMVQIADECEKHGLELLEDGIYRGDEKLGQAGQDNGNWWFTRTDDATQQRIFCNSASDAVWFVSRAELPEGADFLNEYLQYHPLEQMPPVELKHLLDSAELTTA